MNRGDTVRLLNAVGRWRPGQVATVCDVTTDLGILLIVDQRFGPVDNIDVDAFFADPGDLEPAPAPERPAPR